MPLDPAMPLSGDAPAKLGQQTRLADTRFARDEHRLALSRGGTRKGGTEQVELRVAADEIGRVRLSHPSCARSARQLHHQAIALCRSELDHAWPEATAAPDAPHRLW